MEQHRTDGMQLVSDNVYTYYMFDHMFHYTWLIYKGIEFDVRGALEAKQLSVAYISAKDLLSWAMKVFVYSRGEIPNAIEYYFMLQVKRLCDSDTLYCLIENVFYSCAETEKVILDEIEQIKQLCDNHLIPRSLREYIGGEQELNFKNHVAAANTIDIVMKELDGKRLDRLAYPDEVTQLIRNIGLKVTKGR